MNAIELLKRDHEKVKKLLAQLESTTERGVKTREELLHKIEQELLVHTQLEEKVFYPAYKAAGGKEEATMDAEAREEHRTVEALVLPDLKATDPSKITFSGRAKVLKELLEHHIEEEETELFPQAKKLLGAKALEELAVAMEQLRSELKKDSVKNKAA
ncbi:hemerythrin domain-containing protein [Pseudomonas sp. EL_65y_Pfl2_R95]|uniref:hemerythrin domain-containing protein n=1 Tax=Pseudomonas sp. EL_65y_Pfl2_R95 TaxID=3088698 RepID=UPI0030DB1555